MKGVHWNWQYCLPRGLAYLVPNPVSRPAPGLGQSWARWWISPNLLIYWHPLSRLIRSLKIHLDRQLAWSTFLLWKGSSPGGPEIFQGNGLYKYVPCSPFGHLPLLQRLETLTSTPWAWTSQALNWQVNVMKTDIWHIHQVVLRTGWPLSVPPKETGEARKWVHDWKLHRRHGANHLEPHADLWKSTS